MNSIRYMLGFTILIAFNSLTAQNQSPVSWSFEVLPIDSDSYELIATATMKSSWVIYSQFTEDEGPIPTSFMLNGLESQWEELSQSKTEYDELFEVNVTKFQDKAVFKKMVEKGNTKEWTIDVEFMTCDGQKCLPPTVVTKKLSI